MTISHSGLLFWATLYIIKQLKVWRYGHRKSKKWILSNNLSQTVTCDSRLA